MARGQSRVMRAGHQTRPGFASLPLQTSLLRNCVFDGLGGTGTVPSSLLSEIPKGTVDISVTAEREVRFVQGNQLWFVAMQYAETQDNDYFTLPFHLE